MKYKVHANDKWRDEEVTVLNSLPTEPPYLVKPKRAVLELEKLKKTVKTAKEIGAMEADEVEEWNLFFQAEESNFAYFDGLENVVKGLTQ